MKLATLLLIKMIVRAYDLFGELGTQRRVNLAEEVNKSLVWWKINTITSKCILLKYVELIMLQLDLKFKIQQWIVQESFHKFRELSSKPSQGSMNTNLNCIGVQIIQHL